MIKSIKATIEVDVPGRDAPVLGEIEVDAIEVGFGITNEVAITFTDPEGTLIELMKAGVIPTVSFYVSPAFPKKPEVDD